MKKKRLFYISVIFITFCLICGIVIYFTSINNVEFDSEKSEWNCTFFGKKRSFILCLPENPDSKTAIVVMLHGYGGSAFFFQKETEFEKSANPQNYAVLFIEGTPDPKVQTSSKGWHYNNDRTSKNDVKFIVKLCKYCQKKNKLGKKFFAVGFSNGGFMTNKLAVARPDFFSAVVSVGGMMSKDAWETRKSKINSKIGFLQINGTKDDVVPMELNGSNKRNPNPAMENVIDYFVKINKISNECEQRKLSEIATFYNYSSTVGWILIKDGRHNWPTKQWSQIDVNQEILNFFSKF